MARFFGKVGFGITAETAPHSGVKKTVTTEKPYYGDVIRNARKLQEGEKVNSDIRVGNSISIVADNFANENIFAIRYVEWMGTLWIVSDVEVQRPRLLLRLGGVYHGPAPAPVSP